MTMSSRWGKILFDGSRPGRLETLIVSALLVMACVGITLLLSFRYFVGAGDSASMIDLVKQAAAGHGLVDSSFNSANDLWPLLGALADKYCSSDFIPRFRGASVITWHPYWMTFPIAALTLIPGVKAAGAVMALSALSHVGVFGLLWWFLRRQGVPLILTVVFCVAIFVFKPWAESVLGQLYFDRLFILPGTALILLTHLRLTEKAGSLLAIVALAFVCVLISERPAMMVGVFLIGYPILRKGLRVFRSRDCLALMGTGLACLAYVFIYTKFVQESPYLVSWTSMAGMISALQSALIPGGGLFPATMKLFAVLAPFILLAVFDWRMCLIAVGSVVPNLLVSIGGAEKYVFLTHYHMPYLPFVLAGAAMGLVRLWSMVRPKSDQGVGRDYSGIRAGFVMTCMLAAIAAYSNWFNHTDLSRTFVFNNPVDPVLPRALVPGLPNPWVAGSIAMREFSREFVSVIPEGAAVSAPEWIWPSLVDRGGIKIDFLPFGIGIDPYVVMTSARMPDGSYQLQVQSFQPEPEAAKIRTCVQDRVDRNYSLMKQAEYGGLRFEIYSRK